MRILSMTVALLAVAMEAVSGSDAVVRLEPKVFGHTNMWSRAGREALRDELRAKILPGMSMAEVQAILSEPESEWEHDAESIWTYRVHRHNFLQVVFDRSDRVKRNELMNYLPLREFHANAATSVQEVAESDVVTAIGCWRATIPKYGGAHDRVHIGRQAFRHVAVGMSEGEVEKALGHPVAREEQNGYVLSTYRLGPSDFIQLKVSAEKQVLAVQARRYDRGSGVLEVKTLCGSWGEVDDRITDLAAWRATFRGYIGPTDERTGIGKRMETYLKVGMASSEVEEVLGVPQNKVGPDEAGQEGWMYDLFTDSRVSIRFDLDGKVKEIRHIGL